MSRMILGCFCCLLLATGVSASDIGKFPPGQKPHKRPLAPCPNGVLAANACFGYHNTRWTPWHEVCGTVIPTGQAPVSSHAVSTCCDSKGTKAIILFDESARSAAPAQTLVQPAPESVLVKPMPTPSK